MRTVGSKRAEPTGGGWLNYERSKSMSDYIKREDAQDIINEVLSDYLTDSERTMLEDVNAEIGEIPSADVVKVRHATDKGYEDSYGWKDVCSLCGCEFRVSKSANYCPNCGARMDGESDE